MIYLSHFFIVKYCIDEQNLIILSFQAHIINAKVVCMVVGKKQTILIL